VNRRIPQNCSIVAGSRVSSELERGVRNLKQDAKFVGSGHGFCVVRSRIFQEVWVSNSAWLFWRNGAWERGLLIAVLIGVWDGARDGCAQSPPGGFDEGVEHAFPDLIGWRVDAGGR
jgi:hypothetical protein